MPYHSFFYDDDFESCIDQYLLKTNAEPLRSERVFPRYLKKAEQRGCGGVILDRVIFSANGRNETGKGLVIEDYTEREKEDGVKAETPVVMLDRLETVDQPHSFVPKSGFHRCSADLSSLGDKVVSVKRQKPVITFPFSSAALLFCYYC